MLYSARSIDMLRRVAVKVPATTANLGPGFDCLGMALDVWNYITVRTETEGIIVYGEGADSISLQKDNLIYRSVVALFDKANMTPPKLSISSRNEIPLSRGLGSSAAAIVGGLVAGNEMAGRPLGLEDLLKMASSLEGHSDNVAPALIGGCQIVVKDAERPFTNSVSMPEGLEVVLFIPDMPMPTDKARAVLAPSVSREDAVFNLGRVALLVNAFTTGNLALLRVATQDRLHQPSRQAMFPAMKSIFRAALEAGAAGVFLSGSGSTILALTHGKEMTVGYEMAEAARKANVSGRLKVTKPTKLGAHIVEAE
ncbi:MAG: homoserine kinase [Chloroflexi bacterium]|nr:homoserine kinase [Chloroflexota bacterium]